MHPGLSPKLLVLVRRRSGVVARQAGAALGDVGWLMPPDGHVLKALQAERHADIDPCVAEHAAGLDRDIARLRAGWRPSAADLSQAPIMVVHKLHIGMSLDHSDHQTAFQFRGPVVDAEGRLISRGRITSALVAVDAKAGTWARTLNRFYRLANDEVDRSRDTNSDTGGGPS